MLRSWTISDFKSFRTETKVDLGGLTVLAGNNSTGKSSLIQSLLLIKQTLESRVYDEAIVLNGRFVRLGSMEDVFTVGSAHKAVSVGWTLEPSEPDVATAELSSFVNAVRVRKGRGIRSVDCRISFDWGAGDERDPTGLHPSLLETELSVRASSVSTNVHLKRSGHSPDRRARALGLHPLTQKTRRVLSYLPSGASVAESRPALASAEEKGAALRHFLPASIAYRVDVDEERSRQLFDQLKRPRGFAGAGKERLPRATWGVLEEQAGKLSRFPDSRKLLKTFRDFSLRDVTVSEWLGVYRSLDTYQRALLDFTVDHSRERLLAAWKKPTPRYELRLETTPAIHAATALIEQYFTERVVYVGPLRYEPQAIYDLPLSTNPQDVGLRGEATAAVLHSYSNATVSYIASDSYATLSGGAECVQTTLLAAVEDWARYLGIAEHVITVERGKLGHELKVVTRGLDIPQDLTHKGVGVSQILPVLVAALLCPSGSLVVLEQPEIHLHPDVQAKLADFLLALSFAGRQFIVETHSESFINRLRLRMTQDEGQMVSDQCKVYFTQLEAETGTVLEPIRINEFGTIENWPDGFLDQASVEADELMTAAAKKRRVRHESSH